MGRAIGGIAVGGADGVTSAGFSTFSDFASSFFSAAFSFSEIFFATGCPF